MQLYTVYLYLETSLHVSGGTTTHHQERKQLYLQHLVFVTPLLLPAAIVEELELYSNSSTTAAGSSNGVTNTRCCRHSCLCSWWWVVPPPETCRAVSRYNKLCNVAACWMYIRICLSGVSAQNDLITWAKFFATVTPVKPRACRGHRPFLVFVSYPVFCLITSNENTSILHVKTGKAIPLQAWTGPEGYWRFKLPDFKTIGTWKW